MLTILEQTQIVRPRTFLSIPNRARKTRWHPLKSCTRCTWMICDNQGLRIKFSTEMRACVVSNANERILDVVTVGTLGICRIKHVLSIDEEFVAVESFLQLNFSCPDSVLFNHWDWIAPIPFSNHRYLGCESLVCKGRHGR